jgi:hypothetical protein
MDQVQIQAIATFFHISCIVVNFLFLVKAGYL